MCLGSDGFLVLGEVKIDKVVVWFEVKLVWNFVRSKLVYDFNVEKIFFFIVVRMLELCDNFYLVVFCIVGIYWVFGMVL